MANRGDRGLEGGIPKVGPKDLRRVLVDAETVKPEEDGLGLAVGKLAERLDDVDKLVGPGMAHEDVRAPHKGDGVWILEQHLCKIVATGSNTTAIR